MNLNHLGQFGTGGSGGSGGSQPYLSDTGLYAFSSSATNMLDGGTSSRDDVYLTQFDAPVTAVNPQLAILLSKLKKLKKALKVASKKKKTATVKRLKKQIQKVRGQLRALLLTRIPGTFPGMGAASSGTCPIRSLRRGWFQG